MRGLPQQPDQALFLFSAGVTEEANTTPALSEGSVLCGEWQTHLVRNCLKGETLSSAFFLY